MLDSLRCFLDQAFTVRKKINWRCHSIAAAVNFRRHKNLVGPGSAVPWNMLLSSTEFTTPTRAYSQPLPARAGSVCCVIQVRPCLVNNVASDAAPLRLAVGPKVRYSAVKQVQMRTVSNTNLAKSMRGTHHHLTANNNS